MVQQEFENIAADLRQRIIAVARGYRLDADSAEDELDKAKPTDSRFRQPDAMLENAENEHWLDIQLDRLPTKEHAVLHLRQVEHKSTVEIAAIVGICPASVPTLLARARRRLLEEMKRRG